MCVCVYMYEIIYICTLMSETERVHVRTRVRVYMFGHKCRSIHLRTCV